LSHGEKLPRRASQTNDALPNGSRCAKTRAGETHRSSP
jgi:hypothetical protein